MQSTGRHLTSPSASSFEAWANTQSQRVAYAILALLTFVFAASWLSDFIVFRHDDELRRAFARFRILLIASTPIVALLHTLLIRLKIPVAFYAGLLPALTIPAVYLGLGELIADLSRPYFYATYITPFVLTPFLIPLRWRLFWTTFLVAVWLIATPALYPDIQPLRDWGTPIVYTAFAAACAVVFGEAVYRLSQTNYEQRVQIEAVNRSVTAFNEQLSRELDDLEQRATGEPNNEAELRSWLARDVHDHLGQHLAALRLELAVSGNDAADGLTRLHSVSESLIAEYRRLLASIKSQPAAVCSLLPRILEAIPNTTNSINVESNVDLSPELIVDENLAEDIACVLREAAANSIQHARPSTIRVSVSCRDRQIHLSVYDDGSGFSPDHDESTGNGGLGLKSMRARSARHGGSLDVTGDPTNGTTVRAMFPLKEQHR